MSKSPLISEKAHERPHAIRGVCKREPVTTKDYAEYLQDKKEGIMNTLIKIAPNFKNLMSNYVITVPMVGHDKFVKHTIKPFVRDKLCPGDIPSNREKITKDIGRLIKGLEKADKAGEERIAINLETYLTKLVSTKYGTFTGGRKRRGGQGDSDDEEEAFLTEQRAALKYASVIKKNKKTNLPGPRALSPRSQNPRPFTRKDALKKISPKNNTGGRKRRRTRRRTRRRKKRRKKTKKRRRKSRRRRKR